MKNDKSTKRISMVLAAATLTALSATWGASRAEAVIAIIRSTGLFSLAQGQATSAHLVNTGEDRGIVINWTVLDSAGNTLAQSERQTVGMGQSSSFEYRPPDVPEGQRMAVRFVLTVDGDSRHKPGFIATQEVYNAGDGKTTVFLPYVEQ